MRFIHWQRQTVGDCLRRCTCVCLCALLAFSLAACKAVSPAPADASPAAAAAATPTPQATPVVAQGFAITVDQLPAVVCATQEDAQWVLDRLLAAHAVEGAQTSFQQDVAIEPAPGPFVSKEEALHLLQTGGTRAYFVQENDTLATITQSFSISEDDLQAINADVVIQPGATIQVELPASLVTVVAVQTLTEEQSIAFQTQNVNDASLAKGKTSVKQKGVKGLKQRTVTVTYEDGQEVSRTSSDWQVVREPVKKIVLVGTKVVATPTPKPTAKPTAKPSTDASAPSFCWPVTSRRITSVFGEGRGSSRKHAGIDIGDANGNPVVAAAAGKVTRVRNDPDGYGLYLDIDHGNGWTTRYAHNSKILVSVGQTVAQGQKIASVGSTGASSGPHLHFEIQKNGVAKNPLSYLP